jgi:hypothetical protein
MRWPIDDNGDHDLTGYLFRLGLGRQVRERLLLERSIAKRLGFACFADYYAARRAQGWGLDRLAQETGQTRDWVRGVMRRYGPGPGVAAGPLGAKPGPLGAKPASSSAQARTNSSAGSPR